MSGAPGVGWKALDYVVVFAVGALLGLLITTVIRGRGTPGTEES